MWLAFEYPEAQFLPLPPPRTGAETEKNKNVGGGECKIILMTYFHSLPPELSYRELYAGW